MLAHPPLVRPNQVRTAIVVHAVTGIDDEQLVDEAVAVPVIEAPVDIAGFQLLHDVLHQILRVLVVIIAGILLGIAFHLDIYQVEGKVEEGIALRIEVVVYRTLEGRLRQVLGIKDEVPLCQGGIHVTFEIAVVECRKNGQLMMLAMIEVSTDLFGLPARGTTSQHHAFRTRRATTTATLYNSILCCRRDGQQQQQDDSYPFLI